LTAVLSDSLLRALSVSEIETRLKALESALADPTGENKQNEASLPKP